MRLPLLPVFSSFPPIILILFLPQTAPLLLAPLSEVYGRNWIYQISAIIFALFFLPQALAKNIETILVCRFISGIAGSTAVSLVGGALTSSDMRGGTGSED